MVVHRKKPLAPRQLEIMDVVWERGEVTVADVWKVLSAKRDVARNTVQTTLSRLQTQGWLRVRIQGNTHVYSAARSRHKVASELVSRLLHAVFGGSQSQLMLALLEGGELSADEAARIREMIDEAERKSK